MPERNNGNVPISSDSSMRTAISQAHKLGMRAVFFTPIDQPALKRKHANSRSRTSEKGTDILAQDCPDGTPDPSTLTIPHSPQAMERERSSAPRLQQ